MSAEQQQPQGGNRPGGGLATGVTTRSEGPEWGVVPDAVSHRAAQAAGVLLVVATVAVLAADAVEPSFDTMATGRGAVGWAVLLRVLAAAASVGIAVALYPVLQVVGRALAIGSVVFRAIEAVLYLAGVVALLCLASLSARAASDAATPPSTVRALVDVVTSARHEAGLVAVFAFTAGAFMYYALLWRARLVPGWLSVWGLLAVGLLVIASLLALFTGRGVADYILLAAPIFVQELVLGVWLLVKGFTPGGRPAGPLNGPAGAGVDGP